MQMMSMGARWHGRGTGADLGWHRVTLAHRRHPRHGGSSWASSGGGAVGGHRHGKNPMAPERNFFSN